MYMCAGLRAPHGYIIGRYFTEVDPMSFVGYIVKGRLGACVCVCVRRVCDVENDIGGRENLYVAHIIIPTYTARGLTI